MIVLSQYHVNDLKKSYTNVLLKAIRYPEMAFFWLELLIESCPT